MINVLDFSGESDDAIINSAIANKDADGIVVIPAKENREPWILDNAILLPENTTVILNNCTIKLSDKCRDNFFRTANCGVGIEDVEKIHNVHINGIGNVILEGADHPRSTGDSSKINTVPCPYYKEDLIKYADWISKESKESGELDFWDCHNHTYGTDFDKENESHGGGWQNIGILFANVENFSINNITMKDYHCWGISIEAGSFGKITNIRFDAHMKKMIDGMVHNIENQDGVDIRNGCNNILISDISGNTGDDVVALTAIADKIMRKSGNIHSTNVMHSDWSKRESGIRDIIIRNVIASSNLCWLVRLLPVETKICNVIIDNIIDTSKDAAHSGTILLGDADGAYGNNLPDSMDGVTISNVISNSYSNAVKILGYMKDSVITNVISKNRNADTIHIERENALNNVQINNIL